MPVLATLGFGLAIAGAFLTWYKFDVVNITYTLWGISKYLNTDSARYFYLLVTGTGAGISFTTDIGPDNIEKLTTSIAVLLGIAGFVFSVYYFFDNKDGDGIKIGVGFLLALTGLAISIIANVLFLVLKKQK